MGIFNSLEVGSEALSVHGTRLDIHAKNIANLDTPNYVRKIPVINATQDMSFASVLGSLDSKSSVSPGSVAFTGLVEDPTPGQRLYQPGHPDADQNGYVYASNVNPLVDMADAMVAQRAYEANLAVFSIAKTMASRAAEIGK